MIRTFLSGAALAALISSGMTPAAMAADQSIQIDAPYMRVGSAAARSAAAFMTIENHGAQDDRLIAARSDIAQKVELHTHLASGDGIMRMVEVPEGFAIPAHGAHALARGGDHVMFMGLNRTLADGDMIDLTLVFETAGEVALRVPVNPPEAEAGAAMPMGGHSGHSMGKAAGN